MNQRRAKAIRRAAKGYSRRLSPSYDPTYKDIVRQWVSYDEVPLSPLAKIVQFFKGRKKAPTKTVERVIGESRQTILVGGWRFTQQRLKKALRLGYARLIGSAVIPARENRMSLRAYLGIGMAQEGR